jgi:glycosyltransferase involved in cell wall biosynthesis
MKQSLRILYSAGPGDVINTYRHWVKGEDDPTQLSMTYSGMFYEACREGGDRAYVISTCRRKDRIDHGQFLIIHRPSLFSSGPGPMFYVGQMWSDIRLIVSALWFDADVAVVACGNTTWALLQILPLFGIKVVPSLHCMQWPRYRRLTWIQRLFRKIRVPFFTGSAFRVLSISGDVTAQLKQMTAERNRPIVPFHPSYRLRTFVGIPSPRECKLFRILFAGRIERNKGIFDLLEIARRLHAEGRTDIVFDVCGSGPALDEVKRQAKDLSLAARFQCHGHCNWQQMRCVLGEAHIVVVPTRGEFVEGFNKVIAEAVLAGRPAVTSDVCPALAYVGDAVVRVPVDDVQAYLDAILKLCDDAQYYAARRSACLSAQQQFYDLDGSWRSALSKVLDEIRVDHQAAAETDPAALHIAN